MMFEIKQNLRKIHLKYLMFTKLSAISMSKCYFSKLIFK
jgi:hypothetical protein